MTVGTTIGNIEDVAGVGGRKDRVGRDKVSEGGGGMVIEGVLEHGIKFIRVFFFFILESKKTKFLKMLVIF